MGVNRLLINDFSFYLLLIFDHFWPKILLTTRDFSPFVGLLTADYSPYFSDSFFFYQNFTNY